MKKTILIVMLVLTIIVSGCTTNTAKTQTQNTQNNLGMSCAGDTCGVNSATKAEVQKVEVIHFHATNQCPSCIAVGALAEETIKTYYGSELLSGKVTFAHINGDLPENKELVQKYGVTGSSLWIGVYDSNGGFHKEENVNVWYKIQDKPGYMSYLKGIIDKRLVGDFS